MFRFKTILLCLSILFLTSACFQRTEILIKIDDQNTLSAFEVKSLRKLIQDGEAFTMGISGGTDLDPSVIFSSTMPQLLVDAIIPKQLFRGEDYKITWTDPGVSETILLQLGNFSGEETIQCEVAASLEELIIPAELTKVLDRGTLNLDAVQSGFLGSLGVPIKQAALDANKNPTQIDIIIINGFIVFGDVL